MQTDECLINFSRAVKKLEESNEQLRAATELIEKQKSVIASLERRDELRVKEAEALRAALDAAEKAKALQAQRAENAEKMVSNLQREVDKQKRRGNYKAVGGFVLGVILAGATQSR